MNIFLYTLLGIIAFLPIVLWWYSFAFISDNPLNKKRFLVGIFAGFLSVLPIIYMEKILSIFSLENFHVFYSVTNIWSFLGSFQFSLSLAFFLFIIAVLSFLWWIIFIRKKILFSLYVRNFLIFLGIIFVMGFLFFIFSFIPWDIALELKNAPVFSWIFFNTIKLIIFYYVIVAFIEEASKHFNFLQASAFEITSVKSWVESAIFVALGFSFIENILYLYDYMQTYAIGKELLSLYFFRSVFAVIVHVVCSSIVAFYFSKAYLVYKKNGKHLPFIKIFLFGILVSIFLHLFYDVALSLGFSLVLFLYFVGGYLYVSSIFYREEEK